jgi:hypothetical protein
MSGRFANAARLFAVVGLSVLATSAWADDVGGCRDNKAGAARRRPAIPSSRTTRSPPSQRLPTGTSAIPCWRDYDGALTVLNKALELDPDNATVLNSRGLVYFNKGDEDRAMADFDLALQRRPSFPAPINNRGLIYLRHGELLRAYDEFNVALSLNSGNNRAHLPLSSGACRLCASNMTPHWLFSEKAAQSGSVANPPLPLHHLCRDGPPWTRRWPTATRCSRSSEIFRDAGPPRHAYRLKGDLDAALKDYNDAQADPIRSLMSAAARCSRRARTWPPRVPTTVPPAPR